MGIRRGLALGLGLMGFFSPIASSTGISRGWTSDFWMLCNESYGT